MVIDVNSKVTYIPFIEGWEAERHYRCTKYKLLTPFWLSADKMLYPSKKEKDRFAAEGDPIFAAAHAKTHLFLGCDGDGDRKLLMRSRMPSSGSKVTWHDDACLPLGCDYKMIYVKQSNFNQKVIK